MVSCPMIAFVNVSRPSRTACWSVSRTRNPPCPSDSATAILMDVVPSSMTANSPSLPGIINRLSLQPFLDCLDHGRERLHAREILVIRLDDCPWRIGGTALGKHVID